MGSSLEFVGTGSIYKINDKSNLICFGKIVNELGQVKEVSFPRLIDLADAAWNPRDEPVGREGLLLQPITVCVVSMPP